MPTWFHLFIAFLLIDGFSTRFGSSKLIFPRLSFEPNTFLGVAILNPNRDEATLTFTVSPPLAFVPIGGTQRFQIQGGTGVPNWAVSPKLP